MSRIMSNVRNFATMQVVLATVIAGMMTMTSRDALSQTAVKPRILILFDTSGSMTFDVDGNKTRGDGSNDEWTSAVDAGDRYCCPGSGDSRMHIAKEAMTQMLNSTGDIDFALMKFPQLYSQLQSGGTTAKWYSYNQEAGQKDVLRYSGLGGQASDEVGEYVIELDGAPVFIDPVTLYNYDDHFLDTREYLIEEFGTSILEIKSWMNHMEYNSDRTAMTSPNSFESPFAGDTTEQELRADGGTPLGEAVDAAYTYLSTVKSLDSKSDCRPYYLLILADGDFDGKINPVLGYDEVAMAKTKNGVYDLYADLDVETWVIGLAAQSPVLDAMADVGGCHYDSSQSFNRVPHSSSAGYCGTLATDGGHAYFADSKETLSSVLAEIISSAIVTEVCDGVDNDCDDVIDEGFTKYCTYWDGQGAQNKDSCEYVEEMDCDGVDNNCDGRIDETPTGGWTNAIDSDLGISCGDTEGICEPGTTQCVPGTGPVCVGAIGPDDEVCNSVDDDCDGQIDEDTDGQALRDTSPCGSSVGVCSPGTSVCTNGEWVCNDTEGSAEECDGLDNDCDGLEDETYPEKGDACYIDSDAISTNGCNANGSGCIGECEAGQRTCVGGVLGCAGMVTPKTDNTCNGLDDDCDNAIDDDVPTGTTVCPAGASGWVTKFDNAKSICVAGTKQCCADDISQCSMPGDAGTFVCVPDGSEPLIVDPDVETCNGLDDDCDGSVDEGLTMSCGGCEYGVDTEFSTCVQSNPNAGLCQTGVRACVTDPNTGIPGYSSECVGDVGPQPEECNGLDDDCDGQTDEDLNLGKCYPEGLSGCADGICVGNCELGDYACSLDGVVSCSGYTAPVAEGSVCNNEDDNCNGLVDEGISNVCGSIDAAQWPDASITLGICKTGIQYCSEATSGEDAASWGDCVGFQGPTAELCNGLDDDCDGLNDGDEAADLEENAENSLVGASCGSCDGVYECVRNDSIQLGKIGSYELVCVGRAPEVEICNGLDENCNGVADDGIDPVPCGGCVTPVDDESPCASGNPAAGECEMGLRYCLDGEMTPQCYGSVGPVAEVCDGKDNDCDGLIDEDFNDMEDVICQVAVGECPEGIQQCVDEVDSELIETALHCCDAEVWRATGDCVSPEVSQLEVCDGRDNDCDGSADEDLAGAGETCGQSLGICEPGLMQCVLNSTTQEWGLVCIGGTFGTEESCNCVDDDCDGQVDEEIPPGDVCSKAPNWMSDAALQAAYPDGIGECALGQYECRDCGWECTAPGPTDEVCDGKDNDCDGLVDEDEEVECPLEGSICIEGECAEPCNEGEFVCPPSKSCVTFDGYRICMATVCDKNSDDALPCIYNDYYCTPDQGFEPPCSCDPVAQMCVDVCYGKVCAEGQTCVVADGGRCHADSEGCMVTGCEAGQSCQAIAMCDPATQTTCYECVTDPCAGVTCGEDEYCGASGTCVGTCANVVCPEGQGCEDGVCVNDPCAGVVCKSGVLCNAETGLCDQTLTNPCKGVVCEFHERCESGVCIPDECMNLECPNGTVCIKGSCYDPNAQNGGTQTGDTDVTIEDSDSETATEVADTSALPQNNGDDTDSVSEKKEYGGLDNVLATGMGGCLCATAPGAKTNSGMSWWLVAIAALLVFLRLSRFRLSSRRLLAVIRGSLLLGLLFILVGCQVEPYSLANENDTTKPSAGGSDSTNTGSDNDSSSTGASDSDTNTDNLNGSDSSSSGASGTDSDGTDPDDTGVDCATCDSDETCCQNDVGYQYCVNVQTSPRNCGGCGAACAVVNATAGCDAGKCVLAACQNYYYDQNGDLSDGCEHFCQPTVDPEDNGDKCDGLATSVDPANDNYTPVDNDCDFSFDEDVDFLNDEKNCGYCGHLCLFNHGSSSCSDGQCVLGACDERWWNLNGSDSDGCEYYCDGDSAAAEICDNLDNDCDGQKDEGNPGGGVACYPETSAGCAKNDVGTYTCSGICAAGVMSCVGGNLECTGYQLPETEVCDGLDNNCNGQVDEALRISCGGAPGDDPDLGVCQTGLALCAAVATADGLPGPAVYDTDDDGCVGDVSPAAERCDGLDNDCDGLTDELAAADGNGNNIEVNDGTRLGVACGLGACASYVTQCIGGTITCEDFVAPDVEIACNGIDDDCDGSVDEVATVQCGGSSGVVCNAPGGNCDPYSEGICEVGRYSCDEVDQCAGDVPPGCADSDHCDRCDGLDNDCDGVTDEDALAGFTALQLRCGQCGDGNWECDSPNRVLKCVGATAPAADDPCDGIDNDCNASTPDGSAEPDFETVCDRADDSDNVADGIMRCNSSTGTMYCDETVDYVEVCDGLDNDGDGSIDEDFPLTDTDSDPTAFGCDPCPGRTQVVCDGSNGWQCRYDMDSSGEVDCLDAECFTHAREEDGVWGCDGYDNDCDGEADDDFNFLTDADNCNGCGNSCDAMFADTDKYPNVSTTACSQGVCVITGCDGNYRNANSADSDGCECEYQAAICDTDPDCDKCWSGSAQGVDDDCDGVVDEDAGAMELCDGIDNDCDGAIDVADADLDTDDAPSYICNSACAAAGGTAPKVTCGGTDGWECAYDTAYVELGTDGEPIAQETRCDGIDNDCDGSIDEGPGVVNGDFSRKACDNDDNSAEAQGECVRSGTWACRATPNPADPFVCCEDDDSDGVCDVSENELGAPSTYVTNEILDGLDNDCDGIIDEAMDCADVIVSIDYDSDSSADFDIFAYEASRYDAIDTDAGEANGVACSRNHKLPWTGVTRAEAETACQQLEYTDTDSASDQWHLCSAGQWQAACSLGGAADTLYPYSDTYNGQTCNGIDYTPNNGILPSGVLAGCIAEWGTTDVRDMSGNVEEWTSTVMGSGLYQIRGGSYNDQSDGLTCKFDLWGAKGGDTDTDAFRMDNLGFRCCRGADPEDLCDAVNCDLAIPDDECVGNFIRRYDGSSTCFAGVCDYGKTDVACQNGCSDNALGMGQAGCIDMDGDGYLASGYADTDSIPVGLDTGDCDDFDADAHPGQCEIYSEDGVDNDCDGTTDEVELTATIRDFKKRGTTGGHDDFEMNLNTFNVCTNLVNTTVDATTYKPVYNATTNGLCSTGGYRVITSATTFNQWYNTDTSGTPVNKETEVCIPLKPKTGGVYTAGADDDPNMFFDYGCTQLQYFPIDGKLFADSETPNYPDQPWESCTPGVGDPHNFFFTTEMHFMFRYEAGQTFAFSGDDDLWVFINGNRVMDLGGVHGEENATVALDDLGLTAGNSYRMDIFNAERHTTHSNFLITTTIAGIEAVPK
ncbi:MAG: fibro-slime domain-containing protein [Deltaproteobacteria bacterium]|nr:fibro-slime domain-containing protein [Deltaproteobacteria bacterium]